MPFFSASQDHDAGEAVADDALEAHRRRSRGARTALVTSGEPASLQAKQNVAYRPIVFRDLDGGDVLAKIARMPIREWTDKAQDAAIRQVGPTAQDFHTAFGLGEHPLRISTIDADGIALAAV